MRELSDTHRRAAVSLCKSVVVANDDGPPSAGIFWARTEGGKAMPMDAEPRSDGNLELIEDDPPRKGS